MHLKERSLRATQYLPDIVKLQRSLYDTFHHRLDRRDAKTMTIESFLKSLRNGISFSSCTYYEDIIITVLYFTENTRNEYNERIRSLKKAWALVGNDLKTHGNLATVLNNVSSCYYILL